MRFSLFVFGVENMKQLRLYYKQSGEIIFNIGLEGAGEFPRTVEEELNKLPPDTQVLEIIDSQLIEDCLKHESNYIQNGQLVLGTLINGTITEEPKRDWVTEFEALKQAILSAATLTDLQNSLK